MKYETFLDFKKISKDFEPDLKLWIKFKDGNVITLSNISFVGTLKQMFFEKKPVKASLKTVWDDYHKLLEIIFKDRWDDARIYPAKSINEQDYIVRYTGSGVVTYHNKNGEEITAPRFTFDSEKMKLFEQQKEGEMQIFLSKIRNQYAYQSQNN